MLFSVLFSLFDVPLELNDLYCVSAQLKPADQNKQQNLFIMVQVRATAG